MQFCVSHEEARITAVMRAQQGACPFAQALLQKCPVQTVANRCYACTAAAVHVLRSNRCSDSSRDGSSRTAVRDAFRTLQCAKRAFAGSRFRVHAEPAHSANAQFHGLTGTTFWNGAKVAIARPCFPSCICRFGLLARKLVAVPP